MLRFFRLEYVWAAVEPKVSSSKRLELQASDPLLEGSDQNGRRLPRILTQWKLIKFLLVWVGLSLIIKSIISLGDSEVEDPDAARLMCLGTYSMVWIVTNVGLIVLASVFLWRRRPQDGQVRWNDFGMYQELAAVCATLSAITLTRLITLLVQVGYIPMAAAPSDEKDNRGYLETDVAFRLTMMVALHVISVLWPLWQTFNEPRNLWSTTDSLLSLESVLADILCIQYFRQFLHEKGTSNLIMCWIEIALFKDVDPDDLDSLQRHAERLEERYLTLQSEHALLLSETLRTKVCAELKDVNNITPASFDELEEEVYQLMKPLFILFLNSSNCQHCLYDLEREEALKRLLEVNGMS